MPETELWDAYLPSGQPAGRDLVRGPTTPPGLFHIVCEVLVRRLDGLYLLTQRAQEKQTFPGFWEAGAGGSVLKGEAPWQGVLRELREETGLDGQQLQLIYVQSSQRKERNAFHWGFLCQTEPEQQVVLQPGETADYRWVTKQQLLQAMEQPDFVPTQRWRWQPFLDQI